MEESVNGHYLREEGLVVGWGECERFLLFFLFPCLLFTFLKPQEYNILNIIV